MKISLLLLALLLTGCIVQSLQPFHTGATKVDAPELSGKWELVTAWGEDVKDKLPAWEFKPDEILTWDHQTNSAPIKISYFKLGDVLFVNTTAAEPKVNWYAAWHLRQVHSVARVKVTDATVEFRPLDLGWFTNEVVRAKLPVERITAEDIPIHSFTPAEWEKFLTKHAGNTNAFPATHRYVLKKL